MYLIFGGKRPFLTISIHIVVFDIACVNNWILLLVFQSEKVIDSRISVKLNLSLKMRLLCHLRHTYSQGNALNSSLNPCVQLGCILELNYIFALDNLIYFHAQFYSCKRS